MTLPVEIASRTEAIRSEVEALGAFIVELLYRRAGRRHILTVVADKEGGISLDDCARINRRLGELFDRFAEGEGDASGPDSFFRSSYFLEVNSPGLDRPLKNAEDFLRAKGEAVKVVYRDAKDRVLDCVGKVEEVEAGRVRLWCGDKRASLDLAIDQILKAKREIRF